MTVEPGAEEAGRRPRVLLSAYAIDPTGGSEEMVGWQRSVQSARFFDTWVVCAPHISREGIEGYMEEHGAIPGLEIVYVEKSRWLMILERVPGLFYLSYNLWQREAYKVARRLEREIGFDLVHQVNYCGYREPGYLWKLEAPFVWGPIGGTQNYPTRLLRQAGPIGGLREVARTCLNQITMRFSRRVRLAARRASALRAANRSIAHDLGRALEREDLPVMLEVGAPPVTDRDPMEMGNDADAGPLRILWAGEFRAFKALPHLLDALAGLPDDVEWVLTAAGDGPETGRWRKYAQRLGIDDRITWLGWVSHDLMEEQFSSADLFLFTSLRDTTGSVLLEALAAGTPVVAPDHQGAADVVTDSCGIKVPVTSTDEIVEGYRGAIARLAGDRALLAELSRGAVERAGYYSWERQGERMRDIYAQVISSTDREAAE
jgi:glycosyltransferase involved in cell wall biosynthesis